MNLYLFLVVIVSALPFTAAIAPAAPELSLLTPKGRKYGPCLNSHSITCAVTFINSGTQPLSIRKLRASCACADIMHSSLDFISPGTTGRFSIVFDLESELERGDRTFSVFIESNDPQHPVISWYTVIDILPIIYIQPGELDFRRGNSATQTITVITQAPIRGMPLSSKPLMTMGTAETNFPGSVPVTTQFDWAFSPPRAAGTNTLTIWRTVPEPVTRYGQLVISVDGGNFFNTLKLKTARISDTR